MLLVSFQFELYVKMLRYVVRTLVPGGSSIAIPYTTSSLGSVSRDTVSYLTKVWGLSSEQAHSAAKLVTVKSRKRADCVLKLLKSYGFNDADVVKLISRFPNYVLVDAENTLRPKIEYLLSLGISETHLSAILCTSSRIRSSSLKQLSSLFDFFREFLPSNSDLVHAMRNSSWVSWSSWNAMNDIMPNISTLRAHGASEDIIVKLVVSSPATLTVRNDLFEEFVKRVKEMGIEPLKHNFIHALTAMVLLRKGLWQKKRDLYMKFGWSEEEFLCAVRTQPLIMGSSLNKIEEIMDFAVIRLGVSPSETVRYPNLFLVSLKKRIVPRCSVLQVLISRGVLSKQNQRVLLALICNNRQFCGSYVTPFEKDFPDVVKAYRGELEFKGFIGVSEP